MDQFRNLKFRIAREPWNDSFRLFLGMHTDDGKVMIANNMVFTTVEQGSVIPADAGIQLSGDEASRLADELWEAGVRPKGQAGTAGQIAAMQAHIDDLREILSRETRTALDRAASTRKEWIGTFDVGKTQASPSPKGLPGQKAMPAGIQAPPLPSRSP